MAAMKIVFLTLFLIGATQSVHLCKLFLYSPAGEKYYNYFPLNGDTLQLAVRSPQNAHILLTNSEDYRLKPSYEIVIGVTGNTATVLRRDGVDVARANGAALDANTFRQFTVFIDYETGTIQLLINANTVLISYKDPYFVHVSKFGLASYNLSTAEFQFPCNILQCEGREC